MVLLVLLKRYLGKPCDHFHCVIFDGNRWEQAKSWRKKIEENPLVISPWEFP